MWTGGEVGIGGEGMHRAARLAAHLTAHPAGGHGFSAEEWDARCQLAVGYRIANALDWDLVIFSAYPPTSLLPGKPILVC